MQGSRETSPYISTTPSFPFHDSITPQVNNHKSTLLKTRIKLLPPRVSPSLALSHPKNSTNQKKNKREGSIQIRTSICSITHTHTHTHREREREKEKTSLTNPTHICRERLLKPPPTAKHSGDYAREEPGVVCVGCLTVC